MNKLIFVYNADSGLFGQVTDFAHKVLRPQTYACNLCKLTYGAFSMKREWKDFLETLGTEMDFLHKDEFLKKYPSAKISCFPTVAMERSGNVVDVISCKEINGVNTLTELKTLVSKAFTSVLSHS